MEDPLPGRPRTLVHSKPHRINSLEIINSNNLEGLERSLKKQGVQGQFHLVGTVAKTGSGYVDQASNKLTAILLPQSPEVCTTKVGPS